jgi:hypothetical protein
MTNQQTAADAEFSAMQTLYNALEPLDDDARTRVINYIVARLEITQSNYRQEAATESSDNEEPVVRQEATTKTDYASVAELYDATQPKSNGDKALIAAYWLQVCQGAESFDSQSANKELKHLGQGLANITAAIDTLKNQKPALALQLKKSGKSQQARKVYKVTVAGIKAVEAMSHG